MPWTCGQDGALWRDLSAEQYIVWKEFLRLPKEEQDEAEEIPDGPNGKNEAPTLVEGLRGKGVVSIECGQSWNAALARDGLLYTWGMGFSGELARSQSM
jgi:alpha-tubulin suppressor-like RCC1 family protein